MKIVFYEKSGCLGNKAQKELLQSRGFAFEVKNLLEESWSKAKLEAFFKDLPLKDCINENAPDVKNGLLRIRDDLRESIIESMIQNPILIKRPLVEIDEKKFVGFDSVKRFLQIDEKGDFNTCVGTKNSCEGGDTQ